MAKASAKVVFSLATRNRFWFGITISVSTCLREFLDAVFGDLHAPLAFEVERLGDDADGEDAELLRDARDDGSRPGAGAAAHAGGDEHHVRAREMVANFVDRFLGGRTADFGMRAGAETLRRLDTHLDHALVPWRSSAPARRYWRQRNRPLQSPAAIMLLTALPPAPPTPNTTRCGLSSRMSGTLRLIAIFFVLSGSQPPLLMVPITAQITPTHSYRLEQLLEPTPYAL